MTTLTLPQSPKDLPLKEALEKMTAAGKSGIIWQREDGVLLYRAADVVFGIAKGQRSLADLKGEAIGPERVKEKPVRRGPAFAPGSIHVELGDDLAHSLNQVAAQCYCPECGEPGEEGKLCKIDRVLPTCS